MTPVGPVNTAPGAMPAAPLLVPPVEPLEAARIADFMRSASFEATHPADAELDALAAAVPSGTRIYVSAVPSRPACQSR